jgi:lipopolysaccharide/colanic/teichoic acid biosynthesis glycosyltransferase
MPRIEPEGRLPLPALSAPRTCDRAVKERPCNAHTVDRGLVAERHRVLIRDDRLIRKPKQIRITTDQETAIPSSEPGQSVGALAAAEVGMLPTAEVAASGPSTSQILGRAAIRIFDVVAAASLLVVLLPLIVIVVVAVRVESAGPACFRCDRVGYRGRRLRMIKFRKMRDDAQGPPLTTDGDLRLTRIGDLLSKLKIDEIPQLFHVLRGDMSLVGPRPEAPEFVSLHPRDYAEILSVPPGITGLSQIAFANERRMLDPSDPLTHYVSRILPQKVALDRMYANRRSFSLNLRILFWTAVTVLMRRQVAVHRGSGKMSVRKR